MKTAFLSPGRGRNENEEEEGVLTSPKNSCCLFEKMRSQAGLALFLQALTATLGETEMGMPPGELSITSQTQTPICTGNGLLLGTFIRI